MVLGGRIKEYFRFERKEVTGILVSVILIAFILSFKEWGGEKFDIAVGLVNLAVAFLIVFLGFLVHVSAQKINALRLGYVAEFQYSMYGLIGGLILCFASNGYLFFLGTGEVRIRHMLRMRLGTFRYGLNYWEYAKISFVGPMANIFLAVFFKFFYATGSPILEKAVLINIFIAIFSMLPIPFNDGLNIFFGSKPFYVFGFGTILGISLSLIFMEGILLSIMLGLFIGVLIVFLFFVIFDKGLEINY